MNKEKQELKEILKQEIELLKKELKTIEELEKATILSDWRNYDELINDISNEILIKEEELEEVMEEEEIMSFDIKAELAHQEYLEKQELEHKKQDRWLYNKEHGDNEENTFFYGNEEQLDEYLENYKHKYNEQKKDLIFIKGVKNEQTKSKWIIKLFW